MGLSRCSLVCIIYILLVVGVTIATILTPIFIEQVLLGRPLGVGSLIALGILVSWGFEEDANRNLLKALMRRLGCIEELYDP